MSTWRRGLQERCSPPNSRQRNQSPAVRWSSPPFQNGFLEEYAGTANRTIVKNNRRFVLWAKQSRINFAASSWYYDVEPFSITSRRLLGILEHIPASKGENPLVIVAASPIEPVTSSLIQFLPKSIEKFSDRGHVELQGLSVNLAKYLEHNMHHLKQDLLHLTWKSEDGMLIRAETGNNEISDDLIEHIKTRIPTWSSSAEKDSPPDYTEAGNEELLSLGMRLSHASISLNQQLDVQLSDVSLSDDEVCQALEKVADRLLHNCVKVAVEQSDLTEEEDEWDEDIWEGTGLE